MDVLKTALNIFIGGLRVPTSKVIMALEGIDEDDDGFISVSEVIDAIRRLKA